MTSDSKHRMPSSKCYKIVRRSLSSDMAPIIMFGEFFSLVFLSVRVELQFSLLKSVEVKTLLF
jgi:hypothetical protein